MTKDGMQPGESYVKDEHELTVRYPSANPVRELDYDNRASNREAQGLDRLQLPPDQRR